MIGLIVSAVRRVKPSSDIRAVTGAVCGFTGIFLNLLLFALKLFAGIISGSASVSADAFNNLSDAGSSIVILIGFRLSAIKPDHGHPFGHGRIEYLSGLGVSALILLMGFELAKSSVEKIITPQPSEFKPVVLIILAVSVLVKLYMALYNRKYGKKINSSSVLAASTDSISDCVATGAVLICTLISHYSSINIDGWCSLAISLFIVYAGFAAMRDTVGPLLGQPADKDLISRINSIVMSNPEVIGMHDLIVHDYGPGRFMISLHAEVSSSGSFTELHDIIDNIERRLTAELGCFAVIHMDPIETDNEITDAIHRRIVEAIAEIDPSIHTHDFRIVRGTSHTNLIFDAVVPYGYKLSDQELTALLSEKITAVDPDYRAVISIDKEY